MRTVVMLRSKSSGKVEKELSYEGEVMVEVYVSRDDKEPRLLAKLEVTA